MEGNEFEDYKMVFGGGSVFPSASAIQRIEAGDKKQNAEKNARGSNDLETLRLTLPSVAMDAIAAAQSLSLQMQEANEITMTRIREKPDGPPAEILTSDDTSDDNIDLKREEKDVTKRKKKKHKHKHKHKKLKHHHKTESPVHSSNKEHSKIPVGAVFLDEIYGLKPEHAYHIDRKKNKDLWVYKSISSRHIAKYRSFSRNCLGSSQLFLDNKDSRKTKNNNDFARYFGKVGRLQVYIKGTSLAVEVPEQSNNVDFIPLPRLADAKALQSEESVFMYGVRNEAISLYVQGKGAYHKNSAESDVTQDKDFVLDEMFEKIRCFNQRTRDEPENVSLWLEFVAFQDIVAQREKAGGSAASVSQTANLRELYRPTRSVIDKKLAILDKALDSNPSCLELKLAQLELYQDIWERDKLEKAWENLLFVHSGKVELWQEYLAKQQCSRLQGFTVSGAVKRFHKCFQTLTSIMDGTVKVIQKEPNMEEKTIGLFSQYCNFLHFSGYTERAMATYQALIEFNLHCPSNLNLSSTKERAAEFEKFWESSMPRFGEENAFGWAKWSEQKNKGLDQQMSFVDVNLEEQEDAIIAEQLPLSQTWIKMEQLREKSHFLPWRPNTSKEETEDNAEDPERLVLFDDVYPMLFRLTKSDSCIRIICLFLKFLGMPSTILSDRIQFWEKETGSSRFEQFSKAIFVQCPELSDCYLAEEFSSEWPLHPLLLTFLSNVLLQAESYFSLSDRTFFTLLRLENEVLKNGSRKISKLPALSIKAIKRFGKSVLKESQNRNNLVIWDAYIRLLWACSDKMAETVSMIETAMAMFMGSHILNPDKKYGVCLLSLTYCQILLNFEPLEHIEATFRHSSPTPEDKQQVMSCLGALIENKVFKPGVSVEITPGYILKIRSMYERQITEYTNKLGKAQENTDFLCTLINCFALFEFCASNFDTANSIYESTRFSIKKCEQSLSSLLAVLHALLKNLYLYQLSFITNVMHIILIPRACLRKIIYEGLNEFPECSKLHSAFIKLEERSHIAGRLRQYYSKMLRNSTTLAVPLYAAASELLRHSRIKMESTAASESHDLGIMHRIRSVFEAALSHSISSHCPLLWRLYLNFEFKYGARSKAKGILYRSLQNCPWAKSIFKDGIALFGDVELQEMIDLMTEEEIRVRMPLEEIELLCTVQKKQSEDECKKIENEHDSGNL